MDEGKNQVQVFEPHKSRLPPLKPYLRDFWRRREFATELSKFTDKAEYLDSKLGNVWLVLNPLFLALIFFLITFLELPSKDLCKYYTKIYCSIWRPLWLPYFKVSL